MMVTQGEISNHNFKILSFLKEQQINGSFTDVKIVSTDTVFWAHACVLAPFSALIAKIFDPHQNVAKNNVKWSVSSPCVLKFPVGSSNPNDSSLNSKKCCKECIQKVIDFMYTGLIMIDEDHAEHIKYVGIFLEIEDLLSICDTILENLDLQDSVDRKEALTEFNNKLGNFAETEEKGILSVTKTVFAIKQSNDKQNISEENVFSTQENQLRVSTDINLEILSDVSCKQKFLCDKTNFKECESHITSCDLNKRTDLQADKNFYLKKGSNCEKYVLKNCDLLCSSCPFEGATISELVDHILEAKHKTDVDCFLCQDSFLENDQLIRHLQSHKVFDLNSFTLDSAKKSNKIYECNYCNKKYSWPQNLQRHLRCHKNAGKKCGKCDFIASSDYVLNYHVTKNHTKNFFSCYYENCCFKSIKKGNLKSHITTVHKSERHCCTLCSKTFSLKKNLYRHVAAYHSTSSPIYSCPSCSYSTQRLDNLRKHVSSTHKDVETKIIKDNSYKLNIRNNEKCLESIRSSVNNNSSSNSVENEDNTVAEKRDKNSEKPSNFALDSNKISADNLEIGSNKLRVLDNTFSDDSALNMECGNNLSVNVPVEKSDSNLEVLNLKGHNSDLQKSLPSSNMDCEISGTFAFGEEGGIFTCHNLNNNSGGALILNETTGELTYINLVPQQQTCPVSNDQYETDYSLLENENKNTLILNESTGELDVIKQSKENDSAESNEFFMTKYDDEAMLTFDPVDEDDDDNDLLDIDLSEILNNSNSAPEIPVLNEWTGEINLLPNNFIGGPFLDEQTGQLSVFDLLDNDLIFDCLDEPTSNVILNENTGEMLFNTVNDDNFSSSNKNDLTSNDTCTENNGDNSIFCDDLIFDNNLEYSLNETTGQLSISWPGVSKDSNFSFLLNELTGELSVKEINDQTPLQNSHQESDQ